MKTTICVLNKTDHDVTAWLTLGATPGCLQDVSQVPWITDAANLLQGSFVLPKRSGVMAYAPNGMGFNGNLSFGTPPLNCPTADFPNGVNLCEFIVNNAFQGPNAQETVNNSCVAGVNAHISTILAQIMDCENSLPWNAGPTHPDVWHFENGRIGTNTGRVGVFPVGCDDCTASVAPPACSCPPSYEQPQAAAICTVQRNAQGNGGLIIVEFHGRL